MDSICVTQSDALEWMFWLDDASVDLIVTDPPYPELEEHRSVGTTTRLSQSDGSSNAWYEVVDWDYLSEFLAECMRVLKDDGHLYVFGNDDSKYKMKPRAEEAGFKWWNDIVWYKIAKNTKPAKGMGYHWRKTKEYVQFFEKGKLKLNDLSMSDVQPHVRPYRKYPSQKPVPLIKKIIKNSSQPGDLVIDPFVGSGSTAVAAVQTGRLFSGCDTLAKAIDKTMSRCRENKECEELKSIRL